MLDPRIKIRHLQCFLEVARLGHVGRAAEQLGVTQPAVSKTLRELEQTLAVSLFARTRQGLALTPHGEAFQYHAATGLVALQQAVDSVAPGRARGGTALRVGALPTVAARLVPQAVHALLAARADATVSLTSGPNPFLLDQLKSRALDLVVGRLAAPEQMVGLSFEQLYAERLALVVRPHHPLLDGRPFAMKRILDYFVILPTEQEIIRPMVERLLLANGIGVPSRRLETVSSDFCRVFLRQSDAIWIISYGVVALDLTAGGLVELPADVADTRGAVGITLRADDRPTPIMAQFMTVTRAAAERLRAELPNDNPQVMQDGRNSHFPTSHAPR